MIKRKIILLGICIFAITISPLQILASTNGVSQEVRALNNATENISKINRETVLESKERVYSKSDGQSVIVKKIIQIS